MTRKHPLPSRKRITPRRYAASDLITAASGFAGPRHPAIARLRSTAVDKIVHDVAGDDAPAVLDRMTASPHRLLGELSKADVPSAVAVAREAARHLGEIRENPLPVGGGAASAPGTEPNPRIPMPLGVRPRPASAPIKAVKRSLWVIRGGDQEWLRKLIEQRGARTADALEYATGDHPETGKVLVLRSKPKVPPENLPIGAPGAVEMAEHPSLEGVFLPTGQDIRPQIRKDALRRALGDRAGRVMWMYPEQGGPRPESLPESAFRPLSDFIQFEAARARALKPQAQGSGLAFEPFQEPGGSGRRQEAVPEPPKRPRGRQSAPETAPEPIPEPIAPEITLKSPRKAPRSPMPGGPAVSQTRQEAIQRRAAAEQVLTAGQERPEPPESPQDAPKWTELGEAESALGSRRQASIAFQNALWLRPENATEIAHAWARSQGVENPLGELDAAAAGIPPTPQAADRFAAALVAAEADPQLRGALTSRAPGLYHAMITVAPVLSVRGLWLASSSLARLTGDPLALAKARDVVQARLAAGGPVLGRDLPEFVGGVGGGAAAGVEPYRRLHQLVQDWLSRSEPPSEGYRNKSLVATMAYADFAAAYALAQMGVPKDANALRERAVHALERSPQVAAHPEPHRALQAAYRHRIEQVLNGQPANDRLPDEIMQLTGNDSKALDQIREKSHILAAPVTDRVQSYRNPKEDPWTWLVNLSALPADQLPAAADRALREMNKAPRKDRLLALSSLLGEGPHLGEATTSESLRRAVTEAAHPPQTDKEAETLGWMVGSAVKAATYFDKPEVARQLVESFAAGLPGASRKHRMDAIVAGLGDWGSAFRKMRMQGDLAPVLGQIETSLFDGRTWTEIEATANNDNKKAYADFLRASLKVAEGWNFIGEDARAEPALAAARRLVGNGLPNLPFAAVGPYERPEIIAAYVRAAGAGATPQQAEERLAPFLSQLPSLPNETVYGYLASHYHLSVAEAVAKAMYGEGGGLSAAGRRWADADEFLTRRRVANDLKLALEKAGV